jgi:hypothetical protein
MSSELQQIEAQRQALLTQLRIAGECLRTGLRHAHGFGSAARAHMERAQAHINEAYIAINEIKSVRSVAQLVDDIVRVEQVMDQVKSQQSCRI